MKSTKRRALYVIAALLGALFILACLAGFAACGGGGEEPEPEPTPTVATVSSVSVTSDKTSIAEGETATVTAKVTMSDGSDYKGSYTWSSNSYVEVSGSGASVTVTGKEAGTATVSVAVADSKSGSCSITVTSTTTPEPEPEPEPSEPATVTNVSLSDASVEYGSSATLTASVTMSDGGEYDGSYAWTSSDESVATVSSATTTTNTVTVTGVKCGEATITVTVGEGDDVKTDTCTVTVSEDHTAAVNGRVSQTEEDSEDLKAGQNASGEELAFDATDITVSYDETTKNYTIDGVAETFGSDLATAFYGNNATKGAEHADCQYITFTLAVNAGETMKITCTNGTDDTKVRAMYGDGVDGTTNPLVDDNGNTIQTASDGTWVIDLDDHFSETEGCDWKMELEVTYAGGDKVTYTVVFGDIERGVADPTDLQAAINEGGEVALTEDIELTSSLTIGGDDAENVEVTLDLNGNDLTCEGAQKGDHTIIVKAGATLTVTGDGTVDAGGADDTAALYNEGTVILEGGLFTRSKEDGGQEKWQSGMNSYYTVENKGDMTIEEGAVIFNAGDYSTCLKSSSKEENNPAKLTINGGKIYGGKYAVKNDYSGILIMTGGQLGGPRSEDDTLPYRALQNWDNATITGGELLGGNGGAADTDTAADGAEAEGVVIYNNSGENSNTDNLEGIERSYEVGTLTIGDDEGNGPEIIYEGVAETKIEPLADDGATTFATGVAIDSGTVNFKAGTIKCSDTTDERDYNFVGVYLTNGTLNVSGGTISGDEAIVIDCAEDVSIDISITGGTLNGNVVLASDVALSSTFTISATVTLDLNGNTLSCASAHTIAVTAKGDLTVVDSSEEKTGTVDATAHGKAALWNEGTVTLNGGTFERSAEAGMSSSANGGNSYYTVVNHGTMTINEGVTIFNAGAYSSNLENGWYDGGDETMSATLYVYGGHIYGGRYAIKNDSCGTLYIYGGTIGGARSDDDTMPYRALLNWNEAYIYGGTLLGGNGNDSTDDEGYYGDGFAIYNTAQEDDNNSVGKLVIGNEDGTGPEIWYEGQKNGTTGSGYGEAIYMDGGTIIINGGRVWGKEDKNNYSADGIYVYGGALTINGGTISGYFSLEIDGGAVTINGGTFAEPIWFYADEYSNNGTLTFADGVKDDFEVTMYVWCDGAEDYVETEEEESAEAYKYTQKSATGEEEPEGGNTGDTGNGGDEGGNANPGEQES